MLTPFDADEKPAIPSLTIFSGHPASRNLFFRKIAGDERPLIARVFCQLV